MPSTKRHNANTKMVLPIDVQENDRLVMHETDAAFIWSHVVRVKHDACSSHDTHVSVKNDPQNPQEHPRELCLIKCAPQTILT